MDPVSSQAANLLSAVQALLVRQGATIAGRSLMALVGQDLEVLFLATTQGGVKLQLPSGQNLTAQGQLPYPEGTALRVRVLPAPEGEAGIRLKLQEANPPATPTLLAPLTQGEASLLSARLAEASPPPELMPLVHLLSLLTDVQPRSGGAPSAEEVQSAVQQLPAPLRASLGQMLGADPAASPRELADTLLAALLEEPRTPPEAGAETRQTVLQQVASRFQVLLTLYPEIPPEQRDGLDAWLRGLLQGSAEGAPAEAGEALVPQPQLQEALRQLPASLQFTLGQVLGTGRMASPRELAAAVREFLQEARQALPAEAAGMDIPRTTARFQAMLSGLPADRQEGLAAWLQGLVQKSSGGPILPETEQLQAAIRQLPASLRAGLGEALGTGSDASPQALATALRASLVPEARGQQPALASQPLDARLQAVLSGLPADRQEGLAPWLQGLVQTSSDGPVLPGTEQLQTAIRQLPASLRASLGEALGTGSDASPQALATALRASLLQETRGAQPAMDPQLLAARFQAMLSGSSGLPAGSQDGLAAWFRNLLLKAAGETPAAARTAPASASPRPEAALRRDSAADLDALVPRKLAAALEAHDGPKAELPESWESWIRGTLTTLSDPAASPREAAFHALQAKEGTAFFEIPLPWAQATPLQIWVESDAPEGRPGNRDTTRRVLLGLRFTGLGETRLGLAQDASGFRIRVWTEHPEALATEQDWMRKELGGLGKPVDLRIYALAGDADGTIPTVRSLAARPSLSALG